MPRKSVEFIQSVTGNVVIPLDEIPQDIKDLCEDIFKKVSKSDGRVRLAYDTVDELKLEFRQMASYCAQHKPVWTLRKSPTKNLPDTTMDVRITIDVPANGAANAGKQAPEVPANAGAGAKK
jgi:hypothetical protein